MKFWLSARIRMFIYILQMRNSVIIVLFILHIINNLSPPKFQFASNSHTHFRTRSQQNSHNWNKKLSTDSSKLPNVRVAIVGEGGGIAVRRGRRVNSLAAAVYDEGAAFGDESVAGIFVHRRLYRHVLTARKVQQQQKPQGQNRTGGTGWPRHFSIQRFWTHRRFWIWDSELR